MPDKELEIFNKLANEFLVYDLPFEKLFKNLS